MSMTYGVVDTETTGFDHEADRLVEVAVVRDNGSFAHTLTNPGDRRISFGAMATHHITPDQVHDAPGVLEALADVGLGPASLPCSFCSGLGLVQHKDGNEDECPDCDGRGFVQNHPDYSSPDVLVFHNAAFDRGFLPEYLRELPYICTWRCALHMFPQAESHSNGALWYELGLQRPMPPEAGSMPHRALFDALMTRDILEHMVDLCLSDSTIVGYEEDAERTPASALKYLVWLTQQPVILTKCRFGKHRDSLWADVPSPYMEWVLKEDFDEDTKHTCRHHLRERGRLA